MPPVQVRHSSKKSWHRTQLPLVLAWGMTIHKCQGLTFPLHCVVDFMHQPTYQPVAKLGIAFVGMSRCTDFARQAFRNLPAFSEFRKVLDDNMHRWRATFEEDMDRQHDACMSAHHGQHHCHHHHNNNHQHQHQHQHHHRGGGSESKFWRPDHSLE